MTLGENLKLARSRAELTQREAARRANMNYKTLSNWENNVSRPAPDDLIKLAMIYQASVDSILGHHANCFPVDDATPFGEKLREQEGYFTDKETAELAEALKDDDFRTLLKAKRKLPPKELEVYMKMLKGMISEYD